MLRFRQILSVLCVGMGLCLAAAPALASPHGQLKLKLQNPGANTVSYEIQDADLIRHVTVFGSAGGVLMNYSLACPDKDLVTLNWNTIPGGHQWVSIVWIDCETDHGQPRNHSHIWRAERNQNAWDNPQDRSLPLSSVQGGNPWQSRTGSCIFGKTPIGMGFASVDAGGLPPDSFFDVFVQVSSNDLAPGAMLVGPMQTDASGRGKLISEINMPAQQLQGLTIRQGGPNGLVLASVYDGDFDDDGVPNRLDNCPYTHNPDQLDANADGIGDRCDCNQNGEDDWNQVNNGSNADVNRNGVPDECEFFGYCPSDFNHDTFVSGDDFDAFVEAFEAGC